MEQRPQWLTEGEVARMTGRALSTLRNERHLRKNLPYAKIGRSVRYKLDDVVAFMEHRKIKTDEMA